MYMNTNTRILAPEFGFARPASLAEAFALMKEHGPGARLLAGGTDLLVQMKMERFSPDLVISLSGVKDLDGITTGDGLTIGAATTIWTISKSTAVGAQFAALREACNAFSTVSIMFMGTLGGNLCNASPAADGVPALLTLDAVVELASARGTRRLPLADFLTGPRQTARAADEVLLALHLPAPALTGRSAFLKLGARAHLVISIAMVAVRCVTVGGIVTEMAASVGACGPVATRLPWVEAALTGAPVAGLSGRIRPEDVASHLSPIDDVRASAAYRTEAATELLCRAVTEVAR